MKGRNKKRIINAHVSAVILACWISMLVSAIIVTYPHEATRLPHNIIPNTILMQSAVTSIPSEENTLPGLALTNDSNIVKWTFIVYIDADDSSLEEQAIADFIEMASIGSNENINIVVQLDRIPGYDDSYGDWTDCRRFLVTEGLTPDDGNEVMNIGEANMGDPDTLVSFVKWAASNYPSEKYALILSSHGKGWAGCCWDETSGDDNLDLSEMQTALKDISEYIGQPIDVMGFDACLMGMTEVAYEIHDYASVMVASEHAEPSSGWPYNDILSQLNENPDLDAPQLATIVVDSYYTAHTPTGYTMAAVDLTKIDAVVGSLSNLAQAFMAYASVEDTQSIKEYASSVTIALDEAVIYERHGTRWPASHGLAIHFPKIQEEHDSAYNAGTVALAEDTTWEEFLNSYLTYASDNWVTEARTESQEYYSKYHVDLYDFCQHLLNSEP